MIVFKHHYCIYLTTFSSIKIKRSTSFNIHIHYLKAEYIHLNFFWFIVGGGCLYVWSRWNCKSCHTQYMIRKRDSIINHFCKLITIVIISSTKHSFIANKSLYSNHKRLNLPLNFTQCTLLPLWSNTKHFLFFSFLLLPLFLLLSSHSTDLCPRMYLMHCMDLSYISFISLILYLSNWLWLITLHSLISAAPYMSVSPIVNLLIARHWTPFLLAYFPVFTTFFWWCCQLTFSKWKSILFPAIPSLAPAFSLYCQFYPSYLISKRKHKAINTDLYDIFTRIFW